MSSEARQLELPVQVDPLRHCEAVLVEQVDREYGSPSTLVRQFLHWHRANPRVYRLIERFVAELVARGRRRIGIALIWERLRWEIALETGEEPKLNNSYRSFAARLYLLHHPEHAGIFATRRVGPGRERHRA